MRVPGGLASQIARQSTHEGGKVISSTQPAAFTTQEIFLVRPEGLCQWKIPMTPSEIESATFRLVSQMPQPTAPPRTPHA